MAANGFNVLRQPALVPAVYTQALAVPFCANEDNPACAHVVLVAAMTARIAFAREEVQEAWNASIGVMVNSDNAPTVMTAGRSAIRHIRMIEHRAFADVRAHCSTDLAVHRQALLTELTQHVSDAVHSINEHLRVHPSIVHIPLPDPVVLPR